MCGYEVREGWWLAEYGFDGLVALPLAFEVDCVPGTECLRAWGCRGVSDDGPPSGWLLFESRNEVNDFLDRCASDLGALQDLQLDGRP